MNRAVGLPESRARTTWNPGSNVRQLRPFRAAALAVIAWLPIAGAADTSVAIRQYLEAMDAGEAPWVAGKSLNQPDLISKFYRQRNHEPAWVDGARLSREIPNLLSAISQSVAHGFVPERYHRDLIENLQRSGDVPSVLALELLLSDAFLTQALHRGQGIVSPPNLDSEWQLPPAELDAVTLLEDVADKRRNVIDALDTLWPAAAEYDLLVERRAEIVASDDVHSEAIADGPLLRPGQSGDRIVLLKARLLGPGEHTPFYDDDLKREVVAFQRSAGLEPDGIVGGNTLEILNATRVSWIDRIDANLERWRWLPRETPATYLRVNIAAFTLRVYEEGKLAWGSDVIVGRPYRRTPVFTETIKYLVLNPYWNVPFSIATKDKLPLLKADAAGEAGKGFEARPQRGELFVAADAIDWQPVTARNFNYLLRQRPGPNNALGQVKFMLPNPYAVYLHDTPSRELFSKQERVFSSGCVRVAEPLRLAAWLLNRDRHAAAGKIESLLASGETHTLYLKKPVPTYIVYFTAFTADDGEVVFRRDVYGRDKVLIAALREGS